ncbi:XRE family transcriptional regulator [Streptomyces sp. 8K308]|uniref:helix-turn-helix domain-containing protein n=1 Tax=Streptomyces sp. 8K308 TaxID=2530388 RepID=UPI00104ABD0C|nr:helix-turn-helix transcriptional regulator [Streptomyces sp. 8K308]TDC25887.1 XRE family transcriptional regulator [Streptomyces sp. 8K308]
MSADTEIADLAALLEELKRRSGLSYGTLAKRLHMSASTLHRYCKGDGLPPEFATVERFARLCKATPEELVELHRRWIAADTAREREREQRVPAQESPSPAGTPPVSAVPPGPPASPAGRRRRPALVVVAVALATALTVTAGVLLASRDDGSDTTDPTDTAEQPPPEGGEEAPVTVAARPHAVEQGACGNWYLVDAEPESVPPPPDEAAAPGWARAMGAVSAERQYVELTIQSSADETVVLRDLRVRVTRAGDPLPWNLYTGYGGCGGGPVETTAFDVDLDAAAPEPTAAGGQPDLPLWVDETDPLVVYVTASTEAHDVEWYLELDWSSGDREGVLVIDDEGEPFRTSATTGQPEWSFPIGGTEWYSYDAE